MFGIGLIDTFRSPRERRKIRRARAKAFRITRGTPTAGDLRATDVFVAHVSKQTNRLAIASFQQMDLVDEYRDQIAYTEDCNQAYREQKALQKIIAGLELNAQPYDAHTEAIKAKAKAVEAAQKGIATKAAKKAARSSKPSRGKV